MVTAVTAQNTTGVHGVHFIPGAMVASQLQAVLSDTPVGAVKVGMLGNEEIIRAVSTLLRGIKSTPIVLDTVMIAKGKNYLEFTYNAGGAELLQPSAVSALKSELIPLCTVITPNIPEAEHLLPGFKITSEAAMKEACKMLSESLNLNAVLVKGKLTKNWADVLFRWSS